MGRRLNLARDPGKIGKRGVGVIVHLMLRRMAYEAHLIHAGRRYGFNQGGEGVAAAMRRVLMALGPVGLLIGGVIYPDGLQHVIEYVREFIPRDGLAVYIKERGRGRFAFCLGRDDRIYLWGDRDGAILSCFRLKAADEICVTVVCMI